MFGAFCALIRTFFAVYHPILDGILTALGSVQNLSQPDMGEAPMLIVLIRGAKRAKSC